MLSWGCWGSRQEGMWWKVGAMWWEGVPGVGLLENTFRPTEEAIRDGWPQSCVRLRVTSARIGEREEQMSMCLALQYGVFRDAACSNHYRPLCELDGRKGLYVLRWNCSSRNGSVSP